MTPQERLRYHVTEAIERGEAEPIIEQTAQPQGNKPTESKQVVPDPAYPVWTLDQETYAAPSGKKCRGNAVTCCGKLIGKLVGFSEDNAKLVVASVNNAGKLAEALRDIMNETSQSFTTKNLSVWTQARQALTAYEAAQD